MGSSRLGEISWSNAWRRVLQPGYPTEWEQDCLRDVAKLIERQTAQRKSERNSTQTVNSGGSNEANVYVSYAVLTRWWNAAYGHFCKLISRNDLTDGVGFEPTVRYERTHTFQARPTNAANEHRRSISAVTETLLRSLRSETRPKTAPSRIQIVYSVVKSHERQLRAIAKDYQRMATAIRFEESTSPQAVYRLDNIVLLLLTAADDMEDLQLAEARA
jgi:hypothetical protein